MGNMNTIANTRNGKIEFLRFIFAILIMGYHFKMCSVGGEKVIFPSAYLGVEFFFLVSGYLMAASLNKVITRYEMEEMKVPVCKESGSFLWKKFKSLFPAAAIAYILYILVFCLSRNYSFAKFIRTTIKTISCLFLVQQTGIEINITTAIWYLSSMLLAMVIIVPFYYKFPKYFKTIGVMLIGLLFLGWMAQTMNSLESPHTFLSFTFKGNLRAISAIALGALSYSAAERLSKVNFTLPGRVVMLIAEITAYVVSIMYMSLCEASKYDFLIPLVLGVGVTISFSNVTLGAHVLDNKFFAFLGKASFYVYLGSSCVARSVPYLLLDESAAGNKVRFAVYLGVSTLAIAIIWIGSIGWKRFFPILKKWFVIAQ